MADEAPEGFSCSYGESTSLQNRRSKKSWPSNPEGTSSGQPVGRAAFGASDDLTAKQDLEAFHRLVGSERGRWLFGQPAASPQSFCEVLGSFRPLHYFRQLLAHAQKEFVSLKPFMSSAWGLVSRWEVAEPTRHRTPIPEPLVKAVACIALSWGWPNFATVVLACFYGICRIGEVLKAQRKELLTPVDLMTEEQVVYLRIVAPKSRRRGAAVQYTTIDDPLAVRLISRIWQQLDSSSRLFSISPGSFRRRWDSILYVLGVGKEHGITPGSLRGGGATNVGYTYKTCCGK